MNDLQPKVLAVIVLTLGLGLGACGGSSTEKRDPVAPPPAVPNADVGQRRAAQDAALAAEERAETQQRSDAAVGRQPASAP